MDERRKCFWYVDRRNQDCDELGVLPFSLCDYNRVELLSGLCVVPLHSHQLACHSVLRNGRSSSTLLKPVATRIRDVFLLLLKRDLTGRRG